MVSHVCPPKASMPCSMMDFAFSEFWSASLSSVIGGLEVLASFGGDTAFCDCAHSTGQVEHTNSAVARNSLIRFRNGSRHQNCSVFCGFFAEDNPCSSPCLDAGNA